MIRAHELDLADVRTDFDEGESERGGERVLSAACHVNGGARIGVEKLESVLRALGGKGGRRTGDGGGMRGI